MPQYTVQDSSRTTAPALRSDTQIQTSSAAELGLVVDRSSSMEPLVRGLIESFNLLLAEQQQIGAEKEVVLSAAPKRRLSPALPPTPPNVSLSFFSDVVQSVYTGVPAQEVPPLNLETYRPYGGTALNDGIGTMIQAIGKRAQRQTKVLIAILTDGGENSSHQFSREDLLQMISYRRINYGWQFIFIGPRGSDSYAISIGIPAVNVVAFDTDAAGLKLIMGRLSKSMRAYQLGDRNYTRLLLRD